MATKPEGLSTLPLMSSAIYSVKNLDQLPLIRRRQTASAPLRSILLAAATLLVVLLTVIVVYLVVSLCLVQQQLTSVSRELTSASIRLDKVEKTLLRAQKSNQTSPVELSRSESRPTTVNDLLTTSSQQSLSQSRNHRKLHRVRKRQASNPASVTADEDRKLGKDDSRSQSSSTSGVTKRKKNSRDRQFGLVYKHMKELSNKMESLRTAVSHPSALMVLYNNQSTLNEDHTWSEGIRWLVDHNTLFNVQDSSHLIVQTAGTYFIYLQITYNGQRRSVNPTCSHIVMLKNPNYVERNRPLLYGSSTQHKLGKVIRYPPNGGEVRAMDTVHQSGIFQLMVGDRIYVTPDAFSHDCIVSPLKEKTFFGAFRLQASFSEYD